MKYVVGVVACCQGVTLLYLSQTSKYQAKHNIALKEFAEPCPTISGKIMPFAE